jgi:hypothetical protein
MVISSYIGPITARKKSPGILNRRIVGSTVATEALQKKYYLG